MVSVGSIEYTVSVETQQSIDAAKGFDASMDSVQRSAKKTDAEMGKLGTSMTKLAASIGAVVSATAMLNEFKKAVNVAKEFNVVISRLSSLTGLVGPELEQLSKQAREIGATSTLSASQAASAMQLIGSRAPQLLESADALGKVTQAAVVLAEAAGVDMVTAAGIMTSTMNQFNMSAEESDRIINTLAAGARNGAADVSSISAALARAGTQADISGVSIEEFTGLVQALAKGEITASDAGTALRNVLLILDNAADKNLRPSVVGVTAALENLEEAQRNGLDLLKTFGRENITAANILLRNREVYESVTEAVTDTTGAYDQQATNVNNLDGDIKGLSSAYEDLQIIVGQLADDQLRSLTQGLTQLLLYMGESEDGVSRFEKALEYAGMAASAIGAVLAGRVVMAMYAFTAAQIAATRAMTLGTIAANGLRVAMSLLGGPAGIVLLAATAIYQYTSRAKDAKPATDELTGSLHVMSTAAERSTKMFEGLAKGVENLNKQELELRTDRVEKSLLRAQQNLKRYQRMFAGGHKTITTGMIEQQEAHIAELTGQLERLRSRQGESDDGPATTTQAGQEAIKTLEDQLAATKLLGVARARLTALQKLGADVTDEERAEVARLVTEIYNLEKAQAANKKATEDAAQKRLDAAKSDEEALAALTEQLYQTTLEADALRDRQAELMLSDYATPEQVAEVQRLARAIGEAEQKAADLERRRSAFGTDVAGAITGSVSPLSGGMFDDQTERYEAEAQAEQQRYADAMARLQEAKELELEVKGGYMALEEQMAQEHADRLAQIEKAKNDMMMTQAADAFGSMASNLQDYITTFGSENKALMAMMKASAIAQTIIQTYQGAQQAFTAMSSIPYVGPALGAAAAAAAVAGGMARVASIRAQGTRRQGGPVSPGSMYRVNEGGRPEVFQNNMGQQYMIPNERGKVVSNRDAQSGDGIVVNIHNAPPGTQAEQSQGPDGEQMIDIWVADFMADGRTASAVQGKFGLSPQGR